jgi:hypothetical protein
MYVYVYLLHMIHVYTVYSPTILVFDFSIKYN